MREENRRKITNLIEQREKLNESTMTPQIEEFIRTQKELAYKLCREEFAELLKENASAVTMAAADNIFSKVIRCFEDVGEGAEAEVKVVFAVDRLIKSWGHFLLERDIFLDNSLEDEEKYQRWLKSKKKIDNLNGPDHPPTLSSDAEKFLTELARTRTISIALAEGIISVPTLSDISFLHSDFETSRELIAMACGNNFISSLSGNDLHNLFLIAERFHQYTNDPKCKKALDNITRHLWKTDLSLITDKRTAILCLKYYADHLNRDAGQLFLFSDDARASLKKASLIATLVDKFGGDDELTRKIALIVADDCRFMSDRGYQSVDISMLAELDETAKLLSQFPEDPRC